MMMNSLRAQRGVALPVMLIVLMVMLVGTVYLFKASNSTSLSSANLAYDAALAKAADLGLLTGYQWLNDTAKANKATLQVDNSGNGYRATLDTTLTTASSAFWTGSKSLNDGSNAIEYVIHRLCLGTGASDGVGNSCVQTTPNTSSMGTSVGAGQSLASDAPAFNGSAMVHYVITARIAGPRGGNVVTQLVVLIGA